jgi:1,4-dihydroxy-2-naphthoate octaprenyltransferase
MADAGSATINDPAPPGLIAVWLQASRAWTLGMPFMCVSVGTFTALYSRGVFSPWKYLLAALAAMALQAGANMVNDYYDFITGTDSPDWQSPENFGPGLVIQRGYLKPDAVFKGGIVSFIFGVALGLMLVDLCGWPILILGLIGVFGSYFYTAAPLSLAYHGLGDFMVFALMGPGYVLGGYYVQALHFSWAAFIASIPIGLLCSGVLQANNLRDIDNDAAHGKRTMAVIIGRVAAVKELRWSNLGAYLDRAVRRRDWPVSVARAGRRDHRAARHRGSAPGLGRSRSPSGTTARWRCRASCSSSSARPSSPRSFSAACCEG